MDRSEAGPIQSPLRFAWWWRSLQTTLAESLTDVSVEFFATRRRAQGTNRHEANTYQITDAIR
jgi:hypothetical protein